MTMTSHQQLSMLTSNINHAHRLWLFTLKANKHKSKALQLIAYEFSVALKVSNKWVAEVRIPIDWFSRQPTWRDGRSSGCGRQRRHGVDWQRRRRSGLDGVSSNPSWPATCSQWHRHLDDATRIQWQSPDRPVFYKLMKNLMEWFNSILPFQALDNSLKYEWHWRFSSTMS